MVLFRTIKPLTGTLALLLAVACLFACTSSRAEKAVLYTEPLAPLHYEENGKVVGIATEIVNAIFNEAGFKTHIKMYPWNRTYRAVLADEEGFVYTINRTERREQLFKWIGPILDKKVFLYRLKHRYDIDASTIEEAKKYTTAVILGHSLTTALKDKGFREGKELIITPNKKVQMKLFLAGRCDLITGNQYTIHQALKAEGHALKDVEPAVFISAGNYYIGANPGVDDQVIARLQEASVRVQQSGIIDGSIKKYID
ncbi:MAG TPA: transporter substrate-binding domain-containing protein [Desulfopila sp.]|nr:transporter substrate-binding domain-containing protein [Desulfopila sp.]